MIQQTNRFGIVLLPIGGLLHRSFDLSNWAIALLDNCFMKTQEGEAIASTSVYFLR